MAAAAVAVVDDRSALPTLLCSRPCRPDGAEEKPRRRPAPLELGAAAADVRVKNTFVELPATPPLSAAHQGRALPQTCPSHLAGRLLQGTLALDAALWEEEEEASLAEEVPLPLPTPCCLETPLFGGGHHFALAATAADIGVPATTHTFGTFSCTPVLAPQPAAAGTAAAGGGSAARVVLQLAAAIADDDSGACAAAAPSGAPAGAAAAAVPPPVFAAPVFAAAPAPPPPPAGFAPGSTELPSVGSAGHAEGLCRPCAFVHQGRCQNGAACTFCHLCDADERKRRRREKIEQRRALREQQGVAEEDGSSQ